MDVKGSIIREFKDFENAVEFSCKLSVDKDSAIKYMALLYDPESPVVKTITDYIQQRQTAAILAGFEPAEDGKFDDDVDELMRCMDENFNTMIIRFVRFFNSPTYSLLTVTKQAFYNKLQHIINTETEYELDEEGNKVRVGTKTDIEYEKIRGDLMLQSDKLLAKINEYSAKLLNEDRNQNLKKHLFAIIDDELSRIPLSPERQARMKAV